MSYETWLIVSLVAGILSGIGCYLTNAGDGVDRAEAFIYGAVLTFGFLGLAGLGVEALSA